MIKPLNHSIRIILEIQNTFTRLALKVSLYPFLFLHNFRESTMKWNKIKKSKQNTFYSVVWNRIHINNVNEKNHMNFTFILFVLDWNVTIFHILSDRQHIMTCHKSWIHTCIMLHIPNFCGNIDKSTSTINILRLQSTPIWICILTSVQMYWQTVL